MAAPLDFPTDEIARSSTGHITIHPLTTKPSRFTSSEIASQQDLFYILSMKPMNHVTLHDQRQPSMKGYG